MTASELVRTHKPVMMWGGEIVDEVVLGSQTFAGGAGVSEFLMACGITFGVVPVAEDGRML